MIKYFGKFIKDLSIILEPLYNILRNDSSSELRNVSNHFQNKKTVSSGQNLAHFDPKIPIKLVCDDSRVGVYYYM